jgi:hypothetical protein
VVAWHNRFVSASCSQHEAAVKRIKRRLGQLNQASGGLRETLSRHAGSRRQQKQQVYALIKKQTETSEVIDRVGEIWKNLHKEHDRAKEVARKL